MRLYAHYAGATFLHKFAQTVPSTDHCVITSTRIKIMVNFFLRKVKYPLLIQSDTVVFGASNTRQFDRLVEKYSFKTSISFDVVDATGEGWSYYPESNSLSPLTVDKIWSKNRIINFYNASVKDQCPEKLYVARSLSNKRLSVIVEEVVELANKSAVV